MSFCREQRSMKPFLSQPPLSVQCCHATSSSRSDGLTVVIVRDIPRRKDALDARVSPLQRGPANVALRVQIKLALKEIGVRGMTDGHEHAAGLYLFFLT